MSKNRNISNNIITPPRKIIQFYIIFITLVVVLFEASCRIHSVADARIKEDQTIQNSNELLIPEVHPVVLQIEHKSSVYIVDSSTSEVRERSISNNAYSAAVIDCEPGDIFYYTGTHYNYKDQYSIIVTDDNGKTLLKDLGSTLEETAPVSEINYEFTIPDGGRKLYLQSYGNSLLLQKIHYIDLATKFFTIESQLLDLNNKLSADELHLVSPGDKSLALKSHNTIRSISRIGAGTGFPHHSIEAYKEEFRRGFRILLCDLVFTKDNIPVCNHDQFLNQHYKYIYNSNGSLVSTDPPIYFSQYDYQTLSQYHYGRMGYPLLTFSDMLKLVKILGVELYVEIKDMNEQQAAIACDMVKRYGLSETTSWAGSFEQMSWIINNIETARVSLMPRQITDDVIESLNSLKTGKNEVFIFGWDTTILTNEIVDKLLVNSIAFEMGTPKTPKEVIDYFNQGDAYYYCTGIQTNGFVAEDVLLENLFNN